MDLNEVRTAKRAGWSECLNFMGTQRADFADLVFARSAFRTTTDRIFLAVTALKPHKDGALGPRQGPTFPPQNGVPESSKLRATSTLVLTLRARFTWNLHLNPRAMKRGRVERFPGPDKGHTVSEDTANSAVWILTQDHSEQIDLRALLLRTHSKRIPAHPQFLHTSSDSKTRVVVRK